MPTISLIDTLRDATSLLDLARRLGASCLEEEGHLTDLLEDEEVKSYCAHVEALVGQVDEPSWERYSQSGFGKLLGEQGLVEVVQLVATQSPVELLGFLRGLCRGPLTSFFATTEDPITLDYGTPIIFATRPINEIFQSWTPYQPTLGAAGLLRQLPYELFRHPASGAVRVTLDHAERDRLDELTWSAKARLPRVATLHPTLNDSDLESRRWGQMFFDVCPRHWDPQNIVAQLHAARNDEIAVLPELSLPSPDALEAELEAAPERYPPLVVAGSAHVREERGTALVRANESRVYLDGRLVCRHRKIHPFQQGTGEARITEGITGGAKEIVVLSGKHTRMAVVICADLNDSVIPALLLNAGVNLLLVPARTQTDGAFFGAVSDLASRCQALCVVVNARLDPFTTKHGGPPVEPFMVLASVPRLAQDGQSQLYRDPRPQAFSRGTFDPNIPLPAAMKWR